MCNIKIGIDSYFSILKFSSLRPSSVLYRQQGGNVINKF